MKTTKKILTVGTMMMGLFLAAITFVSAQTENSNPAWTTSKGVQKYANKQLFNDENLRKSHIRVSSVSPTWFISKGIHRKKGDSKLAKGNVASEYPTWIISKGVQKIGRKK